MRIKGLFLAMMALGAMSTAATPAPNRNMSMVIGGSTSQPIGHYEFCKTHRGECGSTRNTGPEQMSTGGKWAMVRQINSSVNTTIKPMTDKDIYGKDEFWAYPTTAGDCEDFALLKRRKLIQRGISPSNLLMTVVRKPDGEGHAVLTIRTAEGDFILDNLNGAVKAWNQTPYTFIKRQASNNAGRWVTIDNGRDVMVGALQ